MNATRTLINHPVPSAGKVRELALQEDVRTAEALTVRGGSLTPASALLHRAAPANKAAARHNCTSGPEWGVGGTHGLRARRRPALLDTNPQMAVPGGGGQRNTRRRERDTRVCVGGRGCGAHDRDPSSQKGLDIDFQGGAGHGQLKLGDNVGMKDPQLADALTSGKDFSTSPGEESRAF